MTKNKLLLIVSILLLVVVMVFYNSDKFSQPRSKNDFQKKLQILSNDDLLQQGVYSGATNPSFEMRENVDFLLTPGILVQESISEGVILIYPEE